MVKRLARHGNSWALIIEKPILELLGFHPEMPLEITTDGQALIIRAAPPPPPSPGGTPKGQRAPRKKSAPAG